MSVPKFNDVQVREIRRRKLAGESTSSLALEFGVSIVTIQSLTKGLTYAEHKVDKIRCWLSAKTRASLQLDAYEKGMSVDDYAAAHLLECLKEWAEKTAE